MRCCNNTLVKRSQKVLDKFRGGKKRIITSQVFQEPAKYLDW
ncbi:hypothetical protein [Microcoleus sp. FACHB-SPT15]|nr:hypothetical protein [Microcoleus sp. FACHB-SPT15]